MSLTWTVLTNELVAELESSHEPPCLSLSADPSAPSR